MASFEFRVPVICIGNITVGGTGKTPHTEYLIRLLKDEFRVAVLSRGYKRKTRGFVAVTAGSTVIETGDEPIQMYRKYSGITVAVDRDRVHGVKTILKTFPGTDVIILDDGFQHRKIKPGLSILLCDFNRPMNTDHLLPYGNLRESRVNARRADIVIVTKIPENLSDEQRRMIEKEAGMEACQHLFFTRIIYESPRPVFDIDQVETFPTDNDDKASTGVVLVTGIADPEPFRRFVGQSFSEIAHLKFADHHKFTDKNITEIVSSFNNLKNFRKLLITTEKDAVRLSEAKGLPEEIMRSSYYFPVKVDFPDDGGKKFDKIVKEYVGKDK